MTHQARPMHAPPPRERPPTPEAAQRSGAIGAWGRGAGAGWDRSEAGEVEAGIIQTARLSLPRRGCWPCLPHSVGSSHAVAARMCGRAGLAWIGSAAAGCSCCLRRRRQRAADEKEGRKDGMDGRSGERQLQ